MALPAFRHAGRKVYNGFWPGRRIPKYKFFQNDMAPTVFITAPLFPMVSKGQTLQPSDVEGDHSRGASSTQGSAGPAPAAEPQEACATRGIKKSPGTAEDPLWGQPETPRGDQTGCRGRVSTWEDPCLRRGEDRGWSGGSVESPEAHGSHADAGDEDDTGPLIAGTPGSPAAGTDADAAMLAADDALIQKYVCPL